MLQSIVETFIQQRRPVMVRSVEVFCFAMLGGVLVALMGKVPWPEAAVFSLVAAAIVVFAWRLIAIVEAERRASASDWGGVREYIADDPR